MFNILRLIFLIFCIVGLAGCGNPIDELFKKTDALGKSLRKADVEIFSARLDGRLEDARAILSKSREEIDQFVTDEFEGDRCILRDKYCSFDNANRSDEKAQEIKEAMLAFNKWYEDELEEQQRAESKAVHDNSLLWSRPAMARFMIDDFRNPSWQDVIMFKFFVHDGSDRFCGEAEDVIFNEFKRKNILEKWRAELLEYDLASGEKSLFRSHWFVRFGEYDTNRQAFTNQGQIWQKDPQTVWPNPPLRGAAEGVFDRDRPPVAVAEFSPFCSFSPRHHAARHSALFDAITKQVGEQVTIPDRLVLNIHIASGTDALFDDIPIEQDRAEALVKHYEEIPNWNRRILRAVIDYEIEPARLAVKEEWQRTELSLSARVRDIAFYSFSDYVSIVGIYDREVLDMPPLLSINVE